MIDELSLAGTETQLLALIRSLDRSRVSPLLCLLRGESSVSQSLEPEDCPVLRLGVCRLRQLHTLTAAWRLARFLRQHAVDVLQVYFPDSTLLGVVVGRLAGVRTVVRTRNNLGHWLTPFQKWLGRLLNPLTTLTLTNCQAARQALLNAEHPRPESVVVLENGVDLERFSSIPPLGPGPHRRVGVVANLRPVKGLDVLLQSAAQVLRAVPGARFRIAGQGSERDRLNAQARDLGLTTQVELIGAVDDIPSFLAETDIAVLPSRAEGMSNAVLEYMAAGRAIVATAVGATPELIQHGKHGLLVPPMEPVALAQAIQQLLTDAELACRLGAAARLRVEHDHGRQAMVERFQCFYESLLPATTRR